MQKDAKNKLILELIRDAESIAVIPSKVGGLDAFCAGAGLFHVLKKLEKKVQLIYPGRTPDGCDDLVQKDEITQNVKRRDLVVAIDYSGTEVEKVQYSTEESVFYLRLGPIPRDFDVNRVRSDVQGHKNDLYLIVGAQVPEDLGQTYSEMEKEFLTGKVINIDNTERNTRFGHFNIVDPLKSCISLLALHTAIEWECVIGIEAAKAFLLGITKAKV